MRTVNRPWFSVFLSIDLGRSSQCSPMAAAAATFAATAALCALSLAPPAAAQSLNIDFGNQSGVPSAGYDAAGLPGVWNAIEVPPDFPPPVIADIPLVGLDGQPVRATISVTDGSGTYSDVPLPHPELTGDTAALMRDCLLGAFGPKHPIAITLNGLEDGLYRLITYTWYWPAQEFAMIVVVDPTSREFIPPTGGPWSGELAVGVTHMVNVVQVTGGTLEFFVGGAGLGSFFNGDTLINGLQLWRIDPPCPADLSGDGSVNGLDLAMLLAAWGACPGCIGGPCPCPADLDRGGGVNGIDLAMLLGQWGTCGPAPATCGSKGLGGCYVPHAPGQSAGCDEPACCSAICALDPYCCSVQWDALCVGLANLNGDCALGTHPNCGNPQATADCAQPSSAGVPGCADPECCRTVCQIDPYCCSFGWDAICAAEAALYCSKIPPACGHPGAGGCFDWFGLGNPTPFCDDAPCCEAVCAIDAYCCQEQWDTLCVSLAHATCKRGACGEGAGSCYRQHPATGGCDDSACCQQICAMLPHCCDAAHGGWDSFCVQLAEKLCRRTAAGK